MKSAQWRLFWIFYVIGLGVFAYLAVTNTAFVTEVSPGGILDHQSAGVGAVADYTSRYPRVARVKFAIWEHPAGRRRWCQCSVLGARCSQRWPRAPRGPSAERSSPISGRARRPRRS